VRRSNINKLLQ